MGTSLAIAYDIHGVYTCQTAVLLHSWLLPRERQDKRIETVPDASDIGSAHRKIGAVGTSVIYLAFGNLQLYIQVSALWGWSGA
jgi:hypothetical protein